MCGASALAAVERGVTFFDTAEGEGLDILTHASMNHGDSGAPVFGWWGDGGPYGGDSAGPYIVGVVTGEGQLSDVITNYSSSDRTGNWLGGGSEMPDLVNQAIGAYPSPECAQAKPQLS